MFANLCTCYEMNTTDRYGVLSGQHYPFASNISICIGVVWKISTLLSLLEMQCQLSYSPTTTDFPSSKYCPAALKHLSRSSKVSLSSANVEITRTYCFEKVLIYSNITKRFQILPVKGRFASTRTTTEKNHIFRAV